jgi:serine/threonine-protein kinase
MDWILAYASAVRSPADAIEALRVLPDYLPLPGVIAHTAGYDGAIGTTYLLADRADEAVPYLRRAVSSCFAVQTSLWQIPARLALGMALEKQDARQAACVAYADLLKEWGDAKPRSVSAEEARRRARALRCP